MDKTRQSANLVSENNIFSDITNNRVGIATTNPTSTLQVVGDATISGVVTASSFVGNLTGTASTATEAGTAYGLTGSPNITVGTVTGNLTGTASTATEAGTAYGLTGSPNITVGIVTLSSAVVSGNVSIAGTLTYEDVTNVDSIGIVTARAGIVLGPTANTIQLGTGTTISSPSSDTFTVSTNGSERVRVDSSGRLGIGNTSPDTKLDLDGAFFLRPTSESFPSENGGGLRIRSDTSTLELRGLQWTPSVVYYDINYQGLQHYWSVNGSEKARIDSSGRFGLGTSSPGATLDVSETSSGATVTSLFLRNPAALAAGTVSRLAMTAVNTGSRFAYIDAGVTGASDNGHYLAFGTNPAGGAPTEKARISSSGGFSVGTTANPGAGAIYATGDITAFYSSDIRLKKDIEPISEPIKKLMEISGVTYKWNEEYLKDKDVDGYFVRETEVGVIAQDVEKVLPEVVATRENGYKAVRYEKLVALLIEAVKDQQKQIDELKARLEEV
jgi:hypothetical protein